LEEETGNHCCRTYLQVEFTTGNHRISKPLDLSGQN
jgi:hypothetical protein